MEGVPLLFFNIICHGPYNHCPHFISFLPSFISNDRNCVERHISCFSKGGLIVHNRSQWRLEQ